MSPKREGKRRGERKKGKGIVTTMIWVSFTRGVTTGGEKEKKGRGGRGEEKARRWIIFFLKRGLCSHLSRVKPTEGERNPIPGGVTGEGEEGGGGGGGKGKRIFNANPHLSWEKCASRDPQAREPEK